MGTYSDIAVQYENGISRITINRPEKLNAIRINTYHELIAALKESDRSPDCHTILLYGAGTNFSAGNDLSDLVGGDVQELMVCVKNIFSTAANLKKVLVAAIEGVAVGIGTTILLHCDLVVASSNARFRVPFVNLGVGPEGASSLLLPRAIGRKNAQDVLLTGRFFSAEEALSWGLINRIAEPGKAAETAGEYIDLLRELPLGSLSATKKLIRDSLPAVEPVLDRELALFGELLQTEETQVRIKMLSQKK